MRAVVLPEVLRLRWPIGLGLLAAAAWFVDVDFAHAVNPSEPVAWLDEMGHWFDAWSTWLIIFTIVAGLFASLTIDRFRRARAPLAAFMAAWVGVEAVVHTLKRIVNRPRPIHPEGLGEALRSFDLASDTLSFPSGHAATGFCFAIFVVCLTRKPLLRRLALTFAALIALSRCYVGVHHLSDILAGAAIGWGGMAASWKFLPLYSARVEASEAPRRHGFITLLSGLIAFGWLTKAPARFVDPLTGAKVTGIVRHDSIFRLVFEPFFGPAAKLSSLPDLMSFGFAALAWLAVAFLTWLWFRRGARRLVVIFAVAFSIWGGSVVWLAMSDLLVQDGLSLKAQAPEGKEWVGVDFHSHSDDPADGHVDHESAYMRFRRLGYEVAVRTWHNRWSPALEESEYFSAMVVPFSVESESLFGMEWSGGSWAENPLHILIFARSHFPGLDDEKDWRRMIQAAKAKGAIIVVAHFWRGDETQLPSIDELVEAGVSGFEIANRNQDFDSRALDRLERIRETVRTKGLLGLANSDHHGRRAFNHAWNFVVVDAPLDSSTVWRTSTDDIWTALTKGGDLIRCVVLESRPPPAWLPGFGMPLWAVASYFRELPLKRRAVWIAELVILGFLSSRLQRRALAFGKKKAKSLSTPAR